MVPVPDGRRGVRRRRLPRRSSPGSARCRTPRPCIARPTSRACGCCSTSSRTTPPTSTPWFVEALAAGPGSPERERYVFRPGRGADGAEPPNAWQSVFGGPAWERVTEPDGTPGEWYLHLFAPEQPDLNWENPEVRADFEETLRFWFDRGVDGFRIDVAHSLFKQAGLPDAADMEWPRQPVEVDGELRALAVAAAPASGTATRCTTSTARGARSPTPTTPPRVFVAEAWVDEPGAAGPLPARRTSCTRRSTSPTSCRRGTRGRCGTSIDRDPRRARRRGRPGHLGAVQPRRRRATSSRYARDQQAPAQPAAACSAGRPTSSSARRRARAAAAAHAGPARRRLRLPGRGARAARGRGPARGGARRPDLGAVRSHRPRPRRLPRADPVVRVTRRRTASARRAATPQPWLPQPAGWAALTVEAETGDPGSMLELYRTALRLRRETSRLRGRVAGPGSTCRRASSASPASPGWPAW